MLLTYDQELSEVPAQLPSWSVQVLCCGLTFPGSSTTFVHSANWRKNVGGLTNIGF